MVRSFFLSHDFYDPQAPEVDSMVVVVDFLSTVDARLCYCFGVTRHLVYCGHKLIGGDIMSAASASNTGIGFFGLLTVVFITLKLLGKITWSWWWVISPLFAMPAIILAFVTVPFIFAVMVTLIQVIVGKPRIHRDEP